MVYTICILYISVANKDSEFIRKLKGCKMCARVKQVHQVPLAHIIIPEVFYMYANLVIV